MSLQKCTKETERKREILVLLPVSIIINLETTKRFFGRDWTNCKFFTTRNKQGYTHAFRRIPIKDLSVRSSKDGENEFTNTEVMSRNKCVEKRRGVRDYSPNH